MIRFAAIGKDFEKRLEAEYDGGQTGPQGSLENTGAVYAEKDNKTADPVPQELVVINSDGQNYATEGGFQDQFRNIDKDKFLPLDFNEYYHAEIRNIWHEMNNAGDLNYLIPVSDKDLEWFYPIFQDVIGKSFDEVKAGPKFNGGYYYKIELDFGEIEPIAQNKAALAKYAEYMETNYGVTKSDSPEVLASKVGTKIDPNFLNLYMLSIEFPYKGEDADGDGVFADQDCDDNNPAIKPGAQEICDKIDNNCEGQIDEGDVCGSNPPEKAEPIKPSRWKQVFTGNDDDENVLHARNFYMYAEQSGLEKILKSGKGDAAVDVYNQHIVDDREVSLEEFDRIIEELSEKCNLSGLPWNLDKCEITRLLGLNLLPTYNQFYDGQKATGVIHALESAKAYVQKNMFIREFTYVKDPNDQQSPRYRVTATIDRIVDTADGEEPDTIGFIDLEIRRNGKVSIFRNVYGDDEGYFTYTTELDVEIENELNLDEETVLKIHEELANQFNDKDSPMTEGRFRALSGIVAPTKE